MSNTPLAMTATSMIDFNSLAAELDFATLTAASQAWTGTLNIIHYDPAIDHIRFDNSNKALTATQLSKIEFNSDPTTPRPGDISPAGRLPGPGTGVHQRPRRWRNRIARPPSQNRLMYSIDTDCAK